MTVGPRLAILYSYDTQEHRDWVEGLARRLRDDGVAVTLDRWSLQPGDSIPEFMEKAVRDNPYVALVCTPAYRRRFDDRESGVGYEARLLSGAFFSGVSQHRCIPLLREGEWSESAPLWLAGALWLDFRGDPLPETSYAELLRTVRNEPPLPKAAEPERPPAVPVKVRSMPRLAIVTAVLAVISFSLPRVLQGPMEIRNGEAWAGLQSDVGKYETRAYVLLASAAVVFGLLFATAARLHASRRLRGLNVVWIARSVSACVLAAASVVFGLLNEQTYSARNQFDASAPALAWPSYFAVLYLLAAIAFLIVAFLNPNESR